MDLVYLGYNKDLRMYVLIYKFYNILDVKL